MKSSKKLLSLLLVLCMVFSLTCTAFAAEGEEPEASTYALVDVTEGLTAGTYLVRGIPTSTYDVTIEGVSNAFLSTDGCTATRMMSKDLAIADGKVVTADDTVVWTVTAVEGGVTLYNENAGYLYYDQTAQTANSVGYTTDAAAAGVWSVVVAEDGKVGLQESVSERLLAANRFGTEGSYYYGFACYTATSSVTSNLEFYKLVESAEPEPSLAGKTVILHSNDVHGAITGYTKIAALKAEYEAEGAEVILVDVGDFFQGTAYVSTTKGADAVSLMNAVGYDIATIGNHEFDYGYANLMTVMENAEFQVVCADVLEDGAPIFDANTVYTTESGLKIGFFGMDTPESQTKANPALIQGLTFYAGEDLYACAQAQIDELKEQSDLVICLAHLGVDAESAPNRSTDLYANVTGVDFIIDGHSHTVMTEGANGEPIQSTGTAFANVGVIVIDNETKQIESNSLIPLADYTGSDETVAAAAQAVIDRIDAEYGEVFAKSEVDLNGDKDPGNRTEETNLGDLVTDAMVWSVLKDEGSIRVPAENIVAITNGGGIRAPIAKGDITKKDVNTVLPFGNTVAVVYVTGAELLEALEASTYCTPTAVGGFPQVAGIEFTIDISKEYDANEETYPASTYYGPKSIQRVTIDSINGLPFDAEATYAVITNNFCAAGGDTYYAFASATEQFDTGIPLDEALMAYITDELGGVVGEEYAAPQGRIFVGTTEEIADREALAAASAEFLDVLSVLCDEACYTEASAKGVNDAIDAYLAADTVEEIEAATAALKTAIPELVFVRNTFQDVPSSSWYQRPVDFVQANGLMIGVSDVKFGPNVTMTRAMVVTVLYRAAGAPSVEGLTCPFTDLKANEYYVDAVIWAYNNGIFVGKTDTTFAPNDTITREQMATVLVRLSGVDESDVSPDAALALLKEIYTDAAKVSGYARFSVLVCHEAGLMIGDETGAFNPKAGLTRAQFAQILVNAYDLTVRSVIAPDEAATPASIAADLVA